MYFKFSGNDGTKKVKIPEEIVREMPKGLTAIERDDYINDNVIYCDEYYGKVISQSVAEFLCYFYANTYTPGGYAIYDEMKIGDLTVCVVGDTSREPYTQMFAYHEEKKK